MKQTKAVNFLNFNKTLIPSFKVQTYSFLSVMEI